MYIEHQEKSISD